MKQGATIQLSYTNNKGKTVQREILGENNLARGYHHLMTTAQANPKLAFIKYWGNSVISQTFKAKYQAY